MHTGTGDAALAHDVRPGVVLKYLGQASTVLAALMVVPLGFSLVAGDGWIALRCAVVGALLALGRVQARVPRPPRIQANEALVIVALTFLLASAAMTYPMMGFGLSAPDAFFECVSAVTTTGLSVSGGVRDSPHLFLFLRVWMQWYGGLGFAVFSLALVTRPGLTARQLSGSPGDEQDLIGNTKVHAQSVLVTYCALTVIGTLVLLMTRAGPFSAVVHGLAAVATGGLSAADERLVGLTGWGSRALLIGLCGCGAVPLSLYRRAVRHGWREAAADPQARALLAAGALTAAALVLVLHHLDGLGWVEALDRGPLLAFSAQTTAGLASLEVPHLSSAAKLIVLLAMFTGGAVGSTAGGLKMLRVVVLTRLAQVSVRRTSLPPHAVLEARVGEHRLDEGEIHDAALLLVLLLAVIVVSWLPFLAHGEDALDALFAVVSATSTVGLQTGIRTVGMTLPLKGVLCADMLLGRLEVVALVVLIYPRTWLGKRGEQP